MTGVISAGFQSVATNLNKVILGTETWKKALKNVATAIESSVVSAFDEMGVNWVATQIMMAIEGKATAASSAAANVPIAAAEAEVWAAPAALATIASWGGAAIAAPELVLASMAATTAMAGFSDGGFTGGEEGHVAGLVHGKELVFSSEVVRSIGLGNLTRAHDMATRPNAAPASASEGQAMTQNFHMHADHNAAFRAAMRDPANKRTIIDTHKMAARHV